MRRIISLDGGGIRGIFTLQVLRRIETLLRRESGRDSLVLAEVVDLFAGTSTGAIIATCLSWGMTVDDVEQLYLDHASEMFTKDRWTRRLWSKYRSDAMTQFFREFLVETDGTPALLGSAKLLTKLVIVMRNASTGSPWPVSNNPDAKFNALDQPACNLRLPLWQLLRASTAAPTYFAPEEIEIEGTRHLFVDGGVSAFNNPTLIAVLMATLPEYRLSWRATRSDLHVISIGTGSMRRALPNRRASEVDVLAQLKFVIPALMSAASIEQDLLCRVLGDCVYGAQIDSELGELRYPTLLGANEQKFTYARYDSILDQGTHRMTAREARLDNLASISRLQILGTKYADEAVQLGDLYPREPHQKTDRERC